MKPLICLCSLFSAAAVHAVEQTSSSLPRSTPDRQGISSSAILEFVQAADRQVSEVDAEYNVAFGPAKQPQLIGRAE